MPSPPKHGGGCPSGAAAAEAAVGAAVGVAAGARTDAAAACSTSGSKLPLSSSGGSAASTSEGPSYLLGEIARVPSSSVSHDEALAMSQSALNDPAQDVATVRVSSCSGNWICGRLNFGNLPAEDVAFTMIEVSTGLQPALTGNRVAVAGGRRGRVFVGDVAAGPKYFREISWTLKSVNGCGDFEPAWITNEDHIVLEGPRWVTERLHCNSSISARGTIAHGGEPVVLGVQAKVKDPKPSHKLGCSKVKDSHSLGLSYFTKPPPPADPNLGATLGPLEQSAARPKMLPDGLGGLLHEGSKDDFDFELATRATAARAFPVIPRLDLSDMQNRYKNSSRRHQKGLFDLCDGLPSLRDGAETPGVSRCTSHWLCL